MNWGPMKCWTIRMKNPSGSYLPNYEDPPYWKGQKCHCWFEKQCLCSLPSSTRDKFLAASSLSHWSHDLVFVLGQHGLVHLHHPRRTMPFLHSRHSVHTRGSCAVRAKSHLPTDQSIIPNNVKLMSTQNSFQGSRRWSGNLPVSL